jgi:WD40 repeat protein/tRNA A-37 threonylcarbamoyl transferase component Bud32
MSTKLCSQCGKPLPDDSTAESCLTCESVNQQTLIEKDDARPTEGSCNGNANLADTVPPTADGQGQSEFPVEGDASQETVLSGGTAFDRPSGIEPSQATQYRRFGEYEIFGEIARGGMGVVFKARQVNLNRPVALKMILSAQLASPADVQRFYIEAESAAKLEHPGIVPIYEVGEHHGQHFFSMGLVDGGSLADLLNRDGPLHPRRAAELMQTISDAVQYAHARNIVHRDLKPANVLLDEQGSPKVTDFGLAKNVEQDSGLTATGQVMGTPAYMPPEQASGKIDEVGPLADVYSLGAILFFLLTGRPPFESSSVVELLQLVVQQEAVSPQHHNPSVDLDLATICLKCLRKEPEKRYASSAELASDLGRYLGGEPILARQMGRLERTVKWVRRNPVVASLAALLLVVLAAGTLTSTIFALDAWEEAGRADVKAEDAKREALAASQARDDAKREARAARRGEYNANMLLTQMAWEQYQIGRFVELLNGQQPQLGQDDSRGFEWHYWRKQIDRGHDRLTGHNDEVTSVAFSRYGKRLISGSRDGTVRVWNAETRELVRILNKHEGSVLCVAISPDGQHVVSGGGDHSSSRKFAELKVWDVETGEEVHKLVGHSQHLLSVAFSPDSNRIVSGSYDRTVKVWNAKTGETIFTLEGHSGGVSSVAFSHDGKRIVSGSIGVNRTVKVWDAEKGHEILELVDHTAGLVHSVTFNRDGQQVVSGHSDGVLKVWDLATGKVILNFKGHTGVVRSVAFNPSGKHLVSGSKDGTLKVWDAESGEEILAFRGHTGEVSSVAFSPDGRHLVSGSGDKTVRVWDAEQGQSILTLQGHSAQVRDVAFSPDNQLVISGSFDGTVKVWNSETGRETRTLEGYAGRVITVAFSPDGKRIVSGSEDKMLRVWHVENDREPLTLEGHKAKVSSVAFGPNGNRLVSGGGDKTVRVWDAESGRETLTLKGHTDDVKSVAFSPDGQRIVSGSGDKTVKVWDAENGQVIHTLIGHMDLVFGVAYSHDGERIVSGSGDKTVRVWDAENGQALLTLRGHTERVRSVVFSPDGKRIVSGSGDRTLKVWDAEKGQEVLTLKGHLSGVNSLAFSSDGQRIVSGSTDQTLKVWDARSGLWPADKNP